jgi:hypothetical protein
MKRPAAEVMLIALVSAHGASEKLVEELIEEIKQNAIEADHAYQQEVSNLHNTVDSAIEGLVEVLYNLRNA